MQVGRDPVAELVRERQRAETDRTVAQAGRRRRTARRYVAEAAGLFLAIELFMGFSPHWAVVAGAATGLLAWRLKAGTHLYAWCGFAGQVLLTLLSGSFMITAFVARVSFCAVAGAMHQVQRSDGSEPT